jgi:hypothetical protein
MALAYSEETESEVRAAINTGTNESLNGVYFRIYGKTVKKNCNNCYNKAIEQLIKWVKTKGTSMVNGKYRFTAKWKNKTVVVNIGGTMHKVTSDTLSNATAEAILNSPQYRNDIVEINPLFKESDVKKNTLVNQPLPTPILSISKEAVKGGETLKENVIEKELNQPELKPLTEQVKKRGRPSK